MILQFSFYTNQTPKRLHQKDSITQTYSANVCLFIEFDLTELPLAILTFQSILNQQFPVMMNNPNRFMQVPQAQQVFHQPQTQSLNQLPNAQFQQSRKYFTQPKGEMKKSSIFLSNPHAEQPQAHFNTHQGSTRLEFKKKLVTQEAQPQQQPQVTLVPGLYQGLGVPAGNAKPMMWSSQIIKPASDLRAMGLDGKYAAGAGDLDQRFGAKKTGLESFGRTVVKDEKKAMFTTNPPQGYQPQKRSFEINTGESSFNYPLQAENRLSDKPTFQTSMEANYGSAGNKINYTPNFAPNYSASIGTSSYGSTETYSAGSNAGSAGFGNTASNYGTNYNNYQKPSQPIPDYKPANEYKPFTADYKPLTDFKPIGQHKPITTDQKPITTDYKPITSDYKPINQYKPLTSDFNKPTTDYKSIPEYKPLTDYTSPITDYSKPSSYNYNPTTTSSSYPPYINQPPVKDKSPSNVPPPYTYTPSPSFSTNEPVVKDKNYYLEQAMKSYDFSKGELVETGASYTSVGGGGFSKNKTQQQEPSNRGYAGMVGKEPQLASNLSKSDFQFGKKLGKGQFGEVFLVKHKKTGFICALKILKKSTIHQQKVEVALLRQLKIQFYLHHQNIVDLYGFFHDSQAVYLLLEVCCGGQLFDMIKKQRRLPEALTADIVRQVCLGVDVIHRHNIIHRDIKPENIILHEGVAKICDFGWAVHRGDGLRTTFCGTPMYTSPAMLKGEQYGQTVDIWAIGVLTYELLIGRIPFKIMTQDDLDRILTDQIKFPDYIDVSSTAKDFILKVLNRNKGPELDIDDLLAHRFLQVPKKTNDFDFLML